MNTPLQSFDNLLPPLAPPEKLTRQQKINPKNLTPKQLAHKLKNTIKDTQTVIKFSKNLSPHSTATQIVATITHHALKHICREHITNKTSHYLNPKKLFKTTPKQAINLLATLTLYWLTENSAKTITRKLDKKIDAAVEQKFYTAFEKLALHELNNPAFQRNIKDFKKYAPITHIGYECRITQRYIEILTALASAIYTLNKQKQHITKLPTLIALTCTVDSIFALIERHLHDKKTEAIDAEYSRLYEHEAIPEELLYNETFTQERILYQLTKALATSKINGRHARDRLVEKSDKITDLHDTAVSYLRKTIKQLTVWLFYHSTAAARNTFTQNNQLYLDFQELSHTLTHLPRRILNTTVSKNVKAFIKFLDNVDQISNTSKPIVTLPAPNKIAFQNINFTYPEAATQALTDITFEIYAGQTIALVGENGSGKTTLASIFAGLLFPDSGTIYWDEQDITQINTNSLYPHISLVTQNVTKWPLNIQNSIYLGRSEQPLNRNRFTQALTQTDLQNLVNKLPEHENTILAGTGRYGEGKELSGGQWQRLAIARAIYRNADIIIADEPSAALDAKAEAKIFTALKNAIHTGEHPKIAILVTHRLANIRSVDKIIVLEHGRITETGTHDELIELNGKYAELFNLQAAGYLN